MNFSKCLNDTNGVDFTLLSHLNHLADGFTQTDSKNCIWDNKRSTDGEHVIWNEMLPVWIQTSATSTINLIQIT